jgi:acetyl-CoA carboxylase biotin carboxyl carrier protein
VTLTAKDVAEITRLLEESSFDELHLELDGMKLSLRRGGAPAAVRETPAASAPAPAAATTPAATATAVATGATARTAATTALGADVEAVTAPLLGTFYRAPKPGAAPFVEVGARVEEDSIIGIIEVMKLMNTVRAGVRGEVLEILGRDGVLVEYGEVLLRVKTG